MSAADAAGWWSARTGLGCLVCSHILQLVALSVAGLVLFFVVAQAMESSKSGSSSSSRNTEILFAILFLFFSLLWLASWLWTFISGCFLVLVPNRHNTRALAIACLAWSALLMIEGMHMLPYGLYGGGEYDYPLSIGSLWPSYYGRMYQFFLLPVLEILRLTLLASFLHAAVQALHLRLKALSRLLIILTPTLPIGILIFSLIAAWVTSGIGLAVLPVIGVGSIACILVIGLVLMTKIRGAIRHRLRQPADSVGA
jgi:hypothetical protein